MAEKKVQLVDEIPVDILLEVLLRLAAKSLGRFVCVSKIWARIIRGEDFVRWFSLRSKQPPRFLLAFVSGVKGYQESWSFFSRSTLVSTPPCEPGQFSTLWRSVKVPLVEEEPHYPSSTVCELKKVRHIEPDFQSSTVCELKKLRCIDPCYVHGLISFLYGEEQVVCNPTTGKSITLPTLSSSSEMIVRSFLGYDPVDAQYKVLCLTNVTRFCEHHALTLGSARTQSCSWRMIQCSTPHYALGTNSVCIGGVLYYTASASFATKEPFLAAFDLRSETLESASLFPEGFCCSRFSEATLIDYHGKAALVTPYTGGYGYSPAFTLWVLEDAKKGEWSKQRLHFSPDGTTNFHAGLRMVGASDMGQFIYAPIKFEELYVYFVDHKSNRITSVQLQGNAKHQFGDFFRHSSWSFTFPTHSQLATSQEMKSYQLAGLVMVVEADKIPESRQKLKSLIDNQ